VTSTSAEAVRIVLPAHLKTLAGLSGEALVEVARPVTQRAVIDAIEETYPALRGTIRDLGTMERRKFVRFFACGEDLSHEPPDEPLPEPVATGREPFVVVGAMAGG
jgi:molybdopterin synthase sulfur carrier subunit